ncbi:MAG: M48 family metalloprotease [Oscillospiraceae bacterium]|nr:M48 family metalloprotease [Oscillospiraceae bacterium]
MSKKTFFQQIHDAINNADDNEDNTKKTYNFEKVIYNGNKTRIGTPINFEKGIEFQIVGHFEEMINGSQRTFYILSDPVTKTILDGEYDSFCFDVKTSDNPIDEIPPKNDEDDLYIEYSKNSGNSINWLCIFYFAFYVLLFSLLLWLIIGGRFYISFLIILGIYLITIVFSLTPIAESLMRFLLGVRPLRINHEKSKLLPLFEEVYSEVVKTDHDLSRNIRLYITENMSVNAFAFGRNTITVYRGSLERLNDECIKGLMAHEFGHISHEDTIISLIMTIGNFFYSLLMILLTNIKNKIDTHKDSIIMGLIKFFFDIIFYVFRGIEIISNLLIMHASRQNEYKADLFALNCGFGEEITAVLNELYQMTTTKPETIKKIINSSHPPITKRIERLENVLADFSNK